MANEELTPEKAVALFREAMAQDIKERKERTDRLERNFNELQAAVQPVTLEDLHGWMKVTRDVYQEMGEAACRAWITEEAEKLPKAAFVPLFVQAMTHYIKATTPPKEPPKKKGWFR